MSNYVLINSLKGHTGYIDSLVFSPDSKTFASGSKDKTIKLWDIASYNLIETLEKHENNVHSIIFSNDGKLLYSSSTDKTIK